MERPKRRRRAYRTGAFKWPIAADQKASANAIVGGLRAAFKSENAKAVLLAINSPGGSPVQSGYIYDEIVRLREKHPDKKRMQLLPISAPPGVTILRPRPMRSMPIKRVLSAPLA